MILAGIDIGTNTLRLLVADTYPDSFQEIHAVRRITRLGEGLDRTGILSVAAQERSLQALAAFKEGLERWNPAAVSVAGTSALRNATNAARFISEVRERTGLSIRVLTGEEEARLTLLGVARSVPKNITAGSSLLVVDIGGGSTEIMTTMQGKERAAESFHLGAVYLTERYIRHDPPTPDELDRVRQSIRQILDTAETGTAAGKGQLLVGTAGTITTLAAVDQRLVQYDPDKIHGYALKKAAIDRIVRELTYSTLAQRRGMPGLEHGREDIILAGALIIQEIMERNGRESMIVSDWGLREGILLDLYDKMVTGGSSV
ncbi:MAG: hypothetical protein A2010_03295 [Nitrospirae bacterium GWD2_57_9]|nr:MAG: hypothetical protein A2010_03295 [Nitrospirae bacterium GWD2_57_9]OGW48611.1 MAG: hypothetical protein A2078_08740 [Nitrospirae bacterium GWC2_57_9]